VSVHLVDSVGVVIHARDLTSDPSPVLLLLHGYGDCGEVWREACARIAAPRRMIAIDLRGHGASGWPRDGDYSLEATVADVLAVSAALDLGPFAIAGHSTGGMTALAFAARYPERVTALALLDVDPEIFKDGLERLLPYRGPEAAPSFDAFVAAMADAGDTRRRDAVAGRIAPLVHRGADGLWRWRQDPRLRPAKPVAPLEPRSRESVREMMHRVRAPVLLLRGERSSAVSRSALERLRHSFVEPCDAEEVPDAGHAVLTDAPAAVGDALDRFLRASAKIESGR
jgi:pimeloyl-ACP methyl ester carboxylesterase